MSWVDQNSPLYQELKSLDPALLEMLEQRSSAALLLEQLPKRYAATNVAAEGREQRAWEVVGLIHLFSGRVHEALAIFWQLYQHMLSAQQQTGQVHKGMPLVWISDCFTRLGFAVHAKRYLMLTLVEDALRERGVISPETTGTYFRLAWAYGLADQRLQGYAKQFFALAQKYPKEALFPEALLQRIDEDWLTELPSTAEASAYRLNPQYVHHLLAQLGNGKGEALELLAQYLMSCMPGCRTMLRKRSWSTDYDIVCSMEGFDVDFRSELGRYFVCECKDWKEPANFSVMAKFCRVLDSTKSRFGILFSRTGISGAGEAKFAEREQLKVFQDRGMVIVVLDAKDLEHVAHGENLVQLLRQRYEEVRLDLRGSADAG